MYNSSDHMKSNVTTMPKTHMPQQPNQAAKGDRMPMPMLLGDPGVQTQQAPAAPPMPPGQQKEIDWGTTINRPGIFQHILQALSRARQQPQQQDPYGGFNPFA